MLFTEQCTITGASETGAVDRYKQPITVPAAAVESACWYEPVSQTEDTLSKDQQIDAYTFYVPLTTALPEHAEVTLPVGKFKVSGPVAVVPDGFIVQGFKRAQVVRVRG